MRPKMKALIDEESTWLTHAYDMASCANGDVRPFLAFLVNLAIKAPNPMQRDDFVVL